MNKWIFYGIAAAVLLGGGGYVVYKARGIRNNNPGNIRRTGTKWKGQSIEQTDQAFVQFDTPEWGIRAMTRILKNYQHAHGLNTVQDIIGRWAPDTENNTAAYIQHTAQSLGVAKDQPFDVMEKMPELIAVIIEHENGLQPYSSATIEEGIKREAVA